MYCALTSVLFILVVETERIQAYVPSSSSRFVLQYGHSSSSVTTTHSYHDDHLPMSKNTDDNNEPKNEWGIPYSSDLPSLHTGRRSTSLPNGGRVTLVGAGPGDPDLLTVKAYQLLTGKSCSSSTTAATTTTIVDRTNTIVLVDRLVAPAILDLIRNHNPTVEIKIARKLPGCADLAQEELYWWMYQALNQGKHVIRLKIGDPFVFGRGGEEVLTCRKFGVEPVVVPGVSAAFSAPLLGNIPVTHRGVANQVVMCTGYGREGTSPDLIRYHHEQTCVFLMAVSRLRELSQQLQQQAGYPADTPVAIVEKAGCPDQRTVIGDLTNIADLAEQYKVQPPSTIVVGRVVNVLLDTDDTERAATGLVQNFTASLF